MLGLERFMLNNFPQSKTSRYWLIFPTEQARKMPRLEEYFYRSNSPISMWMSNHREWKDDRQRQEDAVFRSYTSGIWKFDEESWLRRNKGYEYLGSVLHGGGCKVFPAVGGFRMMAYVADGWLCRCWGS